MIELWFVRHGQTDWNLEHRVQGWTDIPLNATGLAEAESLGRFLHGIPFTAIYASDLKRACVTAEVLQRHVGVPVITDARLRERRFGRLEGQVRHKPSAPRNPRLCRDLDSNQTEQRVKHPRRHMGINESADPSAETDNQLQERVSALLAELTEKHDKGRILLVTHGGLIRGVLQHTGYTSDTRLHNTSVTRIRGFCARWRVLHVGDALHLDPHPVNQQTDAVTQGCERP